MVLSPCGVGLSFVLSIVDVGDVQPSLQYKMNYNKYTRTEWNKIYYWLYKSMIRNIHDYNIDDYKPNIHYYKPKIQSTHYLSFKEWRLVAELRER